ncbi:hypothetical protein MKX03_011366 [Papaver bracteatum]|nr:hypothetical protein MKX03_011366 [Papaver bracteatum]
MLRIFPVRNDEVVVNLYQLACRFPMPVDSFTCSLLSAWGISSHQVHPSLCLALKRVLSIFKTYYRFILSADVQKFITPSGRKIPGLPWKVFSCECKYPNVKFRLDGFPKCYKRWGQHFHKFQNWKKDDEGSIPSIPTVTVIESDSESNNGFSPKALEMNSIETNYLQGSSSPSSLIRIRRRLYKTKTTGATSSDAHDFGVRNGKTHFKSLHKGYQPLPFTFNGRRPKNPLVNKASQFVIIPDAMSGKICQSTRRSKCLVNNEYSFKEAISCCPVGGISPAFDGNRESTNSGSSDEVLGRNPESSNNISFGCPSPFTGLGDAEVPPGTEAVRGNNFSNTLFADDTSSSKDNATTSHDAALSPDCRETTRDNEENVIQPSLPSEPLSNFVVFSDVGMMGNGSTNPFPKNENVRVCRPTSIPQSDPGISRPSFLKFATQLNGAVRQRALEGGADRKNTELSVAIRVLTEELDGAH